MSQHTPKCDRHPGHDGECYDGSKGVQAAPKKRCYECRDTFVGDGIVLCPLHAAAQDLLAALEGLLKSALWESDTACAGRDWSLACQMARAAIHKAKEGA